ncbi:hypothetical protein ACROYT_G032042 [Oculina patagonica]
MVQVGSDGKVLKTKSCSKNCYHGYSSSDEENTADTCKIEEVEADSHAHLDLFEHETKCFKMISPAMPVIQKRGCMNTFQYVLLITKLKHLQGTGDVVGHEQMVRKKMAELRLAADPDMEASLQIERAKALYYQNNIEDAKKILKLVIKQEQTLENPGILVGRALNLLTAVYNRQRKFGKAMDCVTRANTCLEGQDSADDKAELHHSYGALLAALPAAKNPEARPGTNEEAYKSYEMADDNVLKAKKHLDLVEFRAAENLALRIKLLLLRSDQYLCEDKVAMAMEKAQEANELIHRHGFQLKFDSATKRIEHLSAIDIQKQENKVQWNSELCSSSSSENLADSEGSHSE